VALFALEDKGDRLVLRPYDPVRVFCTGLLLRLPLLSLLGPLLLRVLNGLCSH
jgi:hypothetical protein